VAVRIRFNASNEIGFWSKNKGEQASSHQKARTESHDLNKIQSQTKKEDSSLFKAKGELKKWDRRTGAKERGGNRGVDPKNTQRNITFEKRCALNTLGE